MTIMFGTAHQILIDSPTFLGPALLTVGYYIFYGTCTLKFFCTTSSTTLLLQTGSGAKCLGVPFQNDCRVHEGLTPLPLGYWYKARSKTKTTPVCAKHRQ